MTTFTRLSVPVALLILVACSNDATSRSDMDTPSREAAGGGSADTVPGHGNRASGANGTKDDGEPGELEVIATGLGSPDAFVVHAGTAYVSTSAGLVKVSPTGKIDKLDVYASRLATDGESLVWATPGGITSAPFVDLMSRRVTPHERFAMNLTAHGGRAFFTLVPSSDSGPRNAGTLLRSNVKTGGSPQPVTTNAAMNYSDIAADASHVFFFAPPNENAVEVRRVRATGGESERIGFVSSGHGTSLLVTESMVFFGVSGDGLYVVPKAGAVAARHIAPGGSPVVSESGVYFLSESDEITTIHHVDPNGESPRLVAHHYHEGHLALAVDETGLYALSLTAGALYKVTKQ